MNGKNIKTTLAPLHNNIYLFRKLQLDRKIEQSQERSSKRIMFFPQTSGITAKQDIILITH